nr:unnamed protein product [Callosobruchus analis]
MENYGKKVTSSPYSYHNKNGGTDTLSGLNSLWDCVGYSAQNRRKTEKPQNDRTPQNGEGRRWIKRTSLVI